MSLGAKALLGLVAMIDLGMLGSSLLMWTGTVTSWAPLVVVLPILAAVVVAVVVLARHNRERDEGEEDTGLTHWEDDKYWRGGLFYINSEDHALLVPRRFGLGWALNFGNPRAAMLLAGRGGAELSTVPATSNNGFCRYRTSDRVTTTSTTAGIPRWTWWWSRRIDRPGDAADGSPAGTVPRSTRSRR
jgi:Ca2+/Na+ antiporter